MNGLQIALTISVVLCIIGFFGYTYEMFVHRITRFTTWKELTVKQWTLFVLALQCPIFVIGSLIVTAIFLR